MKRFVPLLALFAAPFSALAADGISYTYVEGGYAASSIDNGGPDADGWAVRGSVAVTDDFHVYGGYSGQKTDDFDSPVGRVNGVDVDQWNLGAGYNHQISPQLDLLARAGYQKADTDDVRIGSADVLGVDRDGWNVEAGVRGAMTSYLEGYALAGYEDYDKADGEFYARLGAQVKFNQTWGINGEVKYVDDYVAYFVGPRMSF
ncbi:diffusible signal factor-reguated Ax21 faimly protein [Lysobacter panacisoli]|uniref:Ax21 family protein n=1 Tax=Lysobacter panacisoli TaxID=1255263 RepID=A0ABP9LBQ5_9GAMM|nr:diffusible signal factor-reguated Ax21 faimly protein [Lysobacter panacisoli]